MRNITKVSTDTKTWGQKVNHMILNFVPLLGMNVTIRDLNRRDSQGLIYQIEA